MRLELEGREPYVVLFGIPIITAAIVIGSFYLGRMQSDTFTPPPVYVEPKLTITPRVTAEVPEGALHAEVHLPPAQIHEITKEVVKVPAVNVINKVEPTPVHVSVPGVAASPGNTPRFIVIPAPLPVPVVTEAPDTGPALPSETELVTQPNLPSVTPPNLPSVTPPNLPSVTPPETVQPTPVSTDADVPLVEPDVEGKLLPPPRDVGGRPQPR